MIKPLKTIWCMLLGGVLYSAPIAAQSITPELFDFNYLKQSDARLTGTNVSGLRYLEVDKLSMAEIRVRKNKGGFINYCNPDNSFEVNVNTESYFRYNPKTVLYGKISYTRLEGSNWGGSMFFNPGYMPFDMVVFADSTNGKKRIEQYHLIGALSYDLTGKLAVGAKLDYLTADYTKFKDLRHSNYILDLNASLSASYRLTPVWEVGANYNFRRYIEKISFVTEGSNEKTIRSLISYGGFWGLTEDFGRKGYTGSDGGGPFIDIYQGMSVQINYTTSLIRFFNDFSYISRDGGYGQKADNNILLSEHTEEILAYKGNAFLYQGKNRHALSVEVETRDLDNDKTSVTSKTNPETATEYYEYSESVDAGIKSNFKTSASYTYWHNIENYIPTWAVSAAYKMAERKQTAIYYPYYRKQNIRTQALSLSGERNIIQDKNQYRIALGTSYQFGNGNPINDGVYTAPNETAKKPSSLDNLAMKEFEYLTADQIKLNIGLRYSRLFPSLNIEGYVAFDYAYSKAFDTEYMANDYFHEISFKIGCNF